MPTTATIARAIAALGLALASCQPLAHAASTITPLNCGPAGPSAAPNTTPNINTSGTVLIEPAATTANPRVYLEIQLISGSIASAEYTPLYFTLDGTDPSTSRSGEFLLIQPGDRMRWQAVSGTGGQVVYQGAIYAAAPNGAAFSCKVYPQ